MMMNLEDNLRRIEMIGKTDETKFASEESQFEQILDIFSELKITIEDEFRRKYAEMFHEDGMIIVNNIMSDFCRQYRFHEKIAPELNRFVSYMGEWQSFIRQTQLRRNPFYKDKLY